MMVPSRADLRLHTLSGTEIQYASGLLPSKRCYYDPAVILGKEDLLPSFGSNSNPRRKTLFNLQALQHLLHFGEKLGAQAELEMSLFGQFQAGAGTAIAAGRSL